MPKTHPAFRLLRTQTIASLNLAVEQYEHSSTGAVHIHLACDNPENVFLVALRTVPEDSTGVAHILEHTALCGSKRYPVRDPFFMMTRRSLNSFMNAFTSSDWTAYPFASSNRKDFANLLDVYLDAVFFSRLDPLDFAQEGHRLEFTEPENSDSPLVHKGVVYNEMKGAMSSISAMLWHTLNKYLHPATTYHHNSGGDPETIVDLTYEQLVAFYKQHYHPTNAIFMTYGDIPAFEHQETFEALALKHFERSPLEISVPDEKRLFAPIVVEEAYPLSESEMAEDKCHVVIGWLLGKTTDLEQALTAQLIASLLLDNSASPLLHALETTDLGKAPSPLCGLDDSQKEMAFVCGLDGCRRQDAEAVEALIIDCLNAIAENGVAAEDVDSALHQLELHQREIGGDHYPYGLQIIMNALTASTHRGDPVAMLDVDRALSHLRNALTDPDFIKHQVKALLLDNPHRVRLTLRPDVKMNDLKEAATQKTLAEIKSRLSESEKTQIIEDSQALAARQVNVDDADILPKVTLKDVPLEEPKKQPRVTQLARSGGKLTCYDLGTNGLVYQQVVIDAPQLSERLQTLLPYYTNCVTELGVGDRDYLEVQRWQAQVSGSFNAFNSLRSNVDDIHKTNKFITFSAKALTRNHEPLCELMHETLAAVRFEDTKRIKELVAQIRAAREQSVTSNGHSLAMLAAASGMCAAANLSHQLGGLAGIQAIKALDNGLKDAANARKLGAELEEIHQKVAASRQQYLLIAEPHEQQVLNAQFGQWFDKDARSQNAPDWELAKHSAQIAQGWLTNSQVNFCARVFPTVTVAHPDAAALVVLGNVLRNGFLHRAIREQGGAYGGGASQDNSSGSFRFYSYRDPRLEETLEDFDQSIKWALETDLKWQAVEEAILGIIGSIDKPDSPAGGAKKDFHADLHGRTYEVRQRFRERLLNTGIDDLKRVAATYFAPENANTAIIADYTKENRIKDLGLEIHRL